MHHPRCLRQPPSKNARYGMLCCVSSAGLGRFTLFSSVCFELQSVLLKMRAPRLTAVKYQTHTFGGRGESERKRQRCCSSRTTYRHRHDEYGERFEPREATNSSEACALRNGPFHSRIPSALVALVDELTSRTQWLPNSQISRGRWLHSSSQYYVRVQRAKGDG